MMQEHETFRYGAVNLPIRVIFSHFLAFMRDKLATREVFCWPGAWMAGGNLHPGIMALFERQSALFVDKEDNDGVFPRFHATRDATAVQDMFENFYAVNVTYDLTDQWIRCSGPFTYDFRWLAPSGTSAEMKAYGDRHFEMIYGVRPDDAELLINL